MARARNIKPGLFMNPILGKADMALTILFASLWCLADKEGRLEDDPEKIWVYTFPYKPYIKTDELLFELQRMGFIKRYKEQDQSLIQVNEFKKHQRPHHTEKDSVLPACNHNSLILKEPKKITDISTLDNVRTNVVERSDSLIPDLLIPDTGYLIPDASGKPKAVEKSIDLDFDEFWKLYPKRPGANKTQAQRAWIARLKHGEDIIEMQRGAYRYAKYCKAMNVNPKYVKQASTFLGPDKHYLDDWTPTESRNKNQEFVDKLIGRNSHDDDFTFDA